MADEGSILQGIDPSLAPSCPLMGVAWLGAVRWALGEPEIMAAFRRDTGNNWSPGRTGLDRMIDQATGAEKAFFEQFLRWFNENVWGDVGLSAFGSDGDGDARVPRPARNP